MMKNKLFPILTLAFFAIFLFVDNVKAEDNDAHLSVTAPGILDADPQFKVLFNLDAYNPGSGDTYYYFSESEAGTRTPIQQMTVSPVGAVGGSGVINIPANVAPLGKTKMYIIKRSASGDETFSTGLNYDFSARSVCTTCAPIEDPLTVHIPVTPPIGGGQPSPTVPIQSPTTPLSPVTVDPLDTGTYDSALQRVIAIITRVIVAIGVVSSVFLLPYMGILWASGNPENMKKANEWFFSWATGLIFLLLSGVIIRVIGVDILKIK